VKKPFPAARPFATGIWTGLPVSRIFSERPIEQKTTVFEKRVKTTE
jgi:hypothetical protein